MWDKKNNKALMGRKEGTLCYSPALLTEFSLSSLEISIALLTQRPEAG